MTIPVTSPTKTTHISELTYLVASFQGAQKERIRVANRIFAVARADVEIDPGHPLVMHLRSLEETEHNLELTIKRLWRKHPLAPWAKGIKGLGELSMAKLISELRGNPLIAYPRPWAEDGKTVVALPPQRRTLAQLWAYCGVGDPRRKRKEAKTRDTLLSCGNVRIRRELYLISDHFIKARTPVYRDIYDERKALYERDRDWKQGHKDAAARRVMVKALLRDMYEECERLEKLELM